MKLHGMAEQYRAILGLPLHQHPPGHQLIAQLAQAELLRRTENRWQSPEAVQTALCSNDGRDCMGQGQTRTRKPAHARRLCMPQKERENGYHTEQQDREHYSWHAHWATKPASLGQKTLYLNMVNFAAESSCSQN